MKKLIIFALAAALAQTAPGQSPNRLYFPAAGFSIAALDSAPGNTLQQPLLMFLPVANSFGANVGVQVQPYTNSVDSYLELSRSQFKRLGYTILHEQHTETTFMFEYSGTASGRALRFYSRGEKAPDHVYLVTATDTASRWKETGDRLKQCVDSFQRTGQ